MSRAADKLRVAAAEDNLGLSYSQALEFATTSPTCTRLDMQTCSMYPPSSCLPACTVEQEQRKQRALRLGFTGNEVQLDMQSLSQQNIMRQSSGACGANAKLPQPQWIQIVCFLLS